METAHPDHPQKPILLLADSQLFFREGKGLEKIRDWINPSECKAVYIGASNGDVPEYYEIFELAH